MAEVLMLLIFPALLLAAAGWDLASYTIPNYLPLAVLAAFCVFVLVVGLPLTAVGWHLAAGLCALVLGFAFFALNWIGGGDAKLFATVALWFGFSDLLTYVLAASLLGGALTLTLLMARRVPLPAALGNQAWLLRLHDERAGIPYGVALAAGALIVLPKTGIFLIAAVS
jgi:prepilin peptidase CpaA